MIIIFKLTVCLLFLLLFIVFPCIVWLDNLIIQITLCFLSCLVLSVRQGIKHLWRELRMLMPFVVTLMLIYGIFGFIGVKAQKEIHSSILHYWIIFGTNRALLLFSSILYIQILFSFVSIGDIINLPVGINKMKYLILGKSLFDYATKASVDIELHVSLIVVRKIKHSRLRQLINKKLAQILAMIFLVIEESKLGGEIIDNRIRHCHKEVGK